MEREILFHGKRRDNGEWVEGFYAKYGGVSFIGAPNEQGTMLWFAVYSETVGQFTGLTDKNGKRIWKGDVVKFTASPFGYSYNGPVCFHKGSFCIQYKYWAEERYHRIGQTNKWQDMGANGVITYEYEIIGNIHDNPELLNGSES